MRRQLSSFGAGLLIFFVSSLASAFCPDSDCSTTATLYTVKQSCGSLPNCFQSVSALSGKSGTCIVTEIDPSLALGTVQVNGPVCSTNGWLWSVRQPDADDRVTIVVDSGTFEPFVCPVPTLPETPLEEGEPTPRLGHVTVRGQGPSQTKLQGSGSFSVGMDIFGCEDLVVTQLTAEGNNYGVRWLGGGEGTWSWVDMIADRSLAGGGGLTAGWADDCYDIYPEIFRGDTEPSVQNIYESRSVATGPTPAPGGLVGFGYTSECAETYYFGGELVNTMDGPAIVQGGLGMGKNNSWADEPPRFFLFGTQILVDPLNLQTGSVGVGVDVEAPPVGPGAGEVHTHDFTVHVDVDVAPGNSVNAIGFRLLEGAKAFIAGQTFDLNTENGSVIPVQN